MLRGLRRLLRFHSPGQSPPCIHGPAGPQALHARDDAWSLQPGRVAPPVRLTVGAQQAVPAAARPGPSRGLVSW